MLTASSFSSKRSRPFLKLKQAIAAITGGSAIALSLLGTPALAGDPFRTASPHPIDDQTEAAFKAIFEQGNYKAAAELLQTDEKDEPLAYAMKASLAYLNQDWDSLNENATQTRESAERLVQTDSLRGHLYIAAGLFLEGAYTLSTQGTVTAAPTVLSKLDQVFDHLNQAKQISESDPELNLLKGYMDLMLAVNLPFSDPNDAIQRLENYAAPSYLAQRGIAIGYRDLRQPDNALTAVDRALTETPNNPDLFYLKAQILVRQGSDRESLEFFNRALEKQDQLPHQLANQIAWEQCRTSDRVNRVPDGRSRRTCAPLLRRQ